MATTTGTTTQQDYLRDYNIRLTGGESIPQLQEQVEQSLRTQPSSQPPIENPLGWDTEHRQVPPYRPVNTELDRDQRPWGSNGVESAFVFTMLHGVWLKATVNWLWRKTGGKVDDRIFTTKIGGEI
ncbi:hypothetical protein QBC46DRAFT_449280 [Diplogelasinospora grovesii]|uniref:Uncharacterized protein n=1 Tax=Diplogelasinospora grovesii TaxID=303347 RepID=A0AAN6N7T6_9PEZI|nr:hypothetical protein QBC46DRAFT_449280 [Diplogelasinospora grovesii]